MGSRKGSAQAKRRAEFQANLGGMDDIFAREDARSQRADAEREAALQNKACLSKNRYASAFEAEAAIIACEEHGTKGLHSYKCPYCKGWHLTHKPQRKE